MASIIIDRDTFTHALRTLTMHEVCQILQYHKLQYEANQKKTELEDYLLNLLDEGNLSEDIYIAIKGKAFSFSKKFYDGFFYKFRTEAIEAEPKGFLEVLAEYCKGSTNIQFVIKHEVEQENYLNFSIERITYRPVYDIDHEKSIYFKDQLSADVEIYFDHGLVYIHSKNINENKIIKTFLKKVFNDKRISCNTKEKINLTEPKFDTSIVDKWRALYKEGDILSLSAFSIHMLDLLNEFENNNNNFRSISIKSIIFRHDADGASNEECTITEFQYGGQNLQAHERIKEELLEGRKITGFKFEVEHSYTDEETGDEKFTMFPITIVYENNGTLRISIADENTSAKEEILDSAYSDVKKVFVNKFNSKEIINKELIFDYINKFKSTDNKSNLDNSSDDNKSKSEDWVLHV